MSKYCILLLFLLATLGGCDNVPEPLFTMRLEADMVIPAGLNSFDTHYIYIRDVPTRVANYFNGPFSEEGIEQVYPEQAVLSSLFVAIDWAIIREISIRAISSADPSINEEIFYHNRINNSQVKELPLLSSLPDVKDILLQERLTLEVRLNLRNSTPAEIESRLTMNFAVNGPE